MEGAAATAVMRLHRMAIHAAHVGLSRVSAAAVLLALSSGLAPAITHAAPVAEPSAANLPVVSRPWKGDFDAMLKRRIIRVLVPYSKTFYYVERGRTRGITYDVFTAFETEVNKPFQKQPTRKLQVVYLPVGRDELIPKLLDGYGDVIFADLTTTPERRKVVDFSDPMYSGIKEIVVTAPGQPEITTVDQLAGKEVFIRRSSSYFEHLTALNARFASAGKAPMRIREAPAELESEDILEMVNAGLVKATVVDRYKALMWSRVYTKLQWQDGAVVHDGGEDAFMFRKDSPQLKAVLDRFVAANREGTQFGNSVVNRYVKDATFVKNAAGDDERKRFGDVVTLFRKYGDTYNMDYLLMLAQGFQESTLDQNAKSHVGAIGIMQIMPATGKELKVGDIHILDNNVHAGVKYMRFMMDRYFKDEPMTRLDKALFTFAAYNAGPGRVAQLRRDAAKRGLDPNRWFNNVELVAADKIGAETVTYVANIFKYYTAYRLIETEDTEHDRVRDQLQKSKPP